MTTAPLLPELRIRERPRDESTLAQRFIDQAALTQRQIAFAVGISESYMSMICSGQRRGSDQVRAAIGEALGVPIDVLLDDI